MLYGHSYGGMVITQAGADQRGSQHPSESSGVTARPGHALVEARAAAGQGLHKERPHPL